MPNMTSYQKIKAVPIIIILLFFPAGIQASPVTDYDLEVSFDVGSSQLYGVSRISVRTGEELFLNRGALEINHIKLNDRRIDLNLNTRLIKIVPDEPGTMEISYKGVFKDGGVSYERDDAAMRNVIDARGISLTNMWYPEIGGLSRYRLQAVLPKGYEAVSEAEEIRKTEKGEAVEFYFDFPHPLNGINLTASNKFTVKNDNYKDIEIQAYFFNEEARLAGTYIEFAKKYLRVYEGLLGEYPYKRFSIVENFLPTGYSFPTFTLLGSAVVKLPFIVETSLGHEILHQWLGNHVYVDYDRGNWSEGLTTYLADHLYELQKNLGWEYRKQILIDYKSYVTDEKDFPLKGFRSRVDSASRAVGYGKAAMVFHMLKNMTGEKIFNDALKDFINEHRFKEASWSDLKRSFEKFYKNDLDWFFSQWINEPGLPRLEIGDVQVKYAGAEYDLSFVVSQKEKIYKFELPLAVYIKNGVKRKLLEISRKRERFELRLPDKPEKVVFDEDYDVAREIAREEVPPVVARLFGEEKLILALPEKNKKDYQLIIDGFKKQGGLEKSAKDIKEADLTASSIVILGLDNPLNRRLFGKLMGKLPFEEAGFSVIVKENPWNLRKVVGIFNGKSKKEVDAAFRKISHYGKYGMLMFEDGRNAGKEVKPTQRGIIMELNEEAAAVDLSTIKKLSDVINGAADKKIIYAGEVHDVFAHHAVQLDIITGVYKRNNKLAIGMEMFQRPFQQTLDSFTAGKMSEADFLKKSEYFKRWGFDYQLYKPILDLARAEKIPVVALNIKREIIEQVAREGIDSLPNEDKKEIPSAMDFSDIEYKERLQKIFEQHEELKNKNFDFFYQSQIIWDESMSQSISEFLNKKPDHQMIVLAGKGHLEYGSGIPKRTYRRNGLDYSIILIDSEVEKGIADYVVFPKPVEGVTSPKLMVFLKEEEGRLKITGFPENSVSEKAGLKAGDIILSIDDVKMKGMDDIKIHLLYKKLGDTIKVKVMRVEKEQEKKMEFEVTL
ncbi:MAG: ChaN family lipoprotein [Nitrospirae bacterium]|nr:ChaN family lipoprotein [Nitrospirota bacterium]